MSEHGLQFAASGVDPAFPGDSPGSVGGASLDTGEYSGDEQQFAGVDLLNSAAGPPQQWLPLYSSASAPGGPGGNPSSSSWGDEPGGPQSPGAQAQSQQPHGQAQSQQSPHSQGGPGSSPSLQQDAWGDAAGADDLHLHHHPHGGHHQGHQAHQQHHLHHGGHHQAHSPQSQSQAHGFAHMGQPQQQAYPGQGSYLQPQQQHASRGVASQVGPGDHQYASGGGWSGDNTGGYGSSDAALSVSSSKRSLPGGGYTPSHHGQPQPHSPDGNTGGGSGSPAGAGRSAVFAFDGPAAARHSHGMHQPHLQQHQGPQGDGRPLPSPGHHRGAGMGGGSTPHGSGMPPHLAYQLHSQHLQHPHSQHSHSHPHQHHHQQQPSHPQQNLYPSAHHQHPHHPMPHPHQHHHHHMQPPVMSPSSLTLQQQQQLALQHQMSLMDPQLGLDGSNQSRLGGSRTLAEYIICGDFKKNNCNRQVCQYVHNTNNHALRGADVCVDFRKGHCMRDVCRYIHNVNPNARIKRTHIYQPSSAPLGSPGIPISSYYPNGGIGLSPRAGGDPGNPGGDFSMLSPVDQMGKLVENWSLADQPSPQQQQQQQFGPQGGAGLYAQGQPQGSGQPQAGQQFGPQQQSSGPQPQRHALTPSAAGMMGRQHRQQLSQGGYEMDAYGNPVAETGGNGNGGNGSGNGLDDAHRHSPHSGQGGHAHSLRLSHHHHQPQQQQQQQQHGLGLGHHQQSHLGHVGGHSQQLPPQHPSPPPQGQQQQQVSPRHLQPQQQQQHLRPRFLSGHSAVSDQEMSPNGHGGNGNGLSSSISESGASDYLGGGGSSVGGGSSSSQYMGGSPMQQPAAASASSFRQQQYARFQQQQQQQQQQQLSPSAHPLHLRGAQLPPQGGYSSASGNTGGGKLHLSSMSNNGGRLSPSQATPGSVRVAPGSHPTHTRSRSSPALCDDFMQGRCSNADCRLAHNLDPRAAPHHHHGHPNGGHGSALGPSGVGGVGGNGNGSSNNHLQPPHPQYLARPGSAGGLKRPGTPPSPASQGSDMSHQSFVSAFSSHGRSALSHPPQHPHLQLAAQSQQGQGQVQHRGVRANSRLSDASPAPHPGNNGHSGHGPLATHGHHHPPQHPGVIAGSAGNNGSNGNPAGGSPSVGPGSAPSGPGEYVRRQAWSSSAADSRRSFWSPDDVKLISNREWGSGGGGHGNGVAGGDDDLFGPAGQPRETPRSLQSQPQQAAGGFRLASAAGAGASGAVGSGMPSSGSQPELPRAPVGGHLHTPRQHPQIAASAGAASADGWHFEDMDQFAN